MMEEVIDACLIDAPPGNPAARCADGGTWPTPRSGCSPGAGRADAPGRPRTPTHASWRADAHRRGATRTAPAAQPRPGHQQHDQPVPRRAAHPQQRDDLAVTGSIDGRFRFPQAMPRPQPPRHPALLAAGGRGQVPVVGDLIQQRHQPGRRLPGRDGVHHHAPHRAQHAVDPRW